MPNLENAIRERAYHLWLADGCRDGAADAYWLTAQREVLNASMSGSDAGTQPAPSQAATVQTKARAKAKSVKAPAKSKRRAA